MSFQIIRIIRINPGSAFGHLFSRLLHRITQLAYALTSSVCHGIIYCFPYYITSYITYFDRSLINPWCWKGPPRVFSLDPFLPRCAYLLYLPFPVINFGSFLAQSWKLPLQ